MWGQLLGPAASGATAAQPLRMRLLLKGGRPFLIFPSQPRAAAAGLELYPAQRMVARLARTCLRLVFRAGLYPGTTETMVALSLSSPLVKFLIQTSGCVPGTTPLFCSLAGNPNAAGQRFIFLLLDEAGAPKAVVKAGIGEHALKLLEQESTFLEQWGGSQRGLPRLLGKLNDSRVGAFALPYFGPLPDRTLTNGQIGALLSAWVRPGSPMRFLELPQWRRLEAAMTSHPALSTLGTRLREQQVRPALYHGDFAPWNVRTGPEGLVVLDWERGEPVGPPAWDWFHYWVQDGLLVRRIPAKRLLNELKASWATPSFRAYAQETGIAGHELELLLAYLLYIQGIIAPTEGKAGLRALQNLIEEELFIAEGSVR